MRSWKKIRALHASLGDLAVPLKFQGGAVTVAAATDSMQAAKEAAHRRIRDDHRRASDDVAPILDRIARDSTPPTSTPPRLRLGVGITPSSFIRECRMETTVRLLRETSIPVEQITFLVGCEAFSPFTRLTRR